MPCRPSSEARPTWRNAVRLCLPPWTAPPALDPSYDELNPPAEKEYRLTLGDTVYLGAQEYELLAYDEQTRPAL